MAAPSKKKKPKTRKPLNDDLGLESSLSGWGQPGYGLRMKSGEQQSATPRRIQTHSGDSANWSLSQSSYNTESLSSLSASDHMKAHIQASHQINAVTIKFGDFLGQGSFGVVTRCKWQGQEVAVKAIDRKGVVDEEEREALMKEFLHEFHTSFNLRSPRIVQIFGYFLSSDDALCIVMEFAGGGSIRSRLEGFERRAEEPPLILQLRWASDVALGMEYLHNTGIMHRDLKSPNVLLDCSDRGKVADFGLAKAEEAAQKVTGSFHTVMAEAAQMGNGNGSTMGTVNGSPPWMPPEAINGQRSMLSDVYAYGIMIWELRTAKMPWEGEGPVGVLYKVGVLKMRPSPMPADGDEHPLHDLMIRSWDHDEEVRPQFDEAARIAEGIRLALASTEQRRPVLSKDLSKIPEDQDLSASLSSSMQAMTGFVERKATSNDQGTPRTSRVPWARTATGPVGTSTGPVSIEMSKADGRSTTMRRSV